MSEPDWSIQECQIDPEAAQLWDEISRLQAENATLKAKLERVQQFIDGHDRVVGRKPGYLRHYDKCDHGQYGYENCADCTDQVLFQALAGEEG